jgi:hypothetical protein
MRPLLFALLLLAGCGGSFWADDQPAPQHDIIVPTDENNPLFLKRPKDAGAEGGDASRD